MRQHRRGVRVDSGAVVTKPTRGGARKGAGRPPLDAADRASFRLPIHMTEAERATLAAWAKREGRPLSRLMLDRALRAARR